ncbi:SpvB/TcaC N-terminal domain-containing protein [Chryseobacterium indoltheticum]|uniref:SpvB/TcaC N-terminal domain-containing protein n=1 Tax=Chryseobacterium indoltheticum TaxID=254 RepID=UPI003F490F69
METMKGLNNFQPNIALVYNSQNGNGQAGWGWNMPCGLSTITRGGKSKEMMYGHFYRVTNFDTTDPFYLDGQRLIKVNETTFVTEKFSKVKITKSNYGDYQFIIQYPDGKIAKYKELVTGQFYISTFIDPFNHEIHYTYQVDNKVPVLTKVSYGGSNVTNDKFYVNFIYKARNKNIQIYRKGESFITTKIISEINVGSTYVPYMENMYYLMIL